MFCFLPGSISMTLQSVLNEYKIQTITRSTSWALWVFFTGLSSGPWLSCGNCYRCQMVTVHGIFPHLQNSVFFQQRHNNGFQFCNQCGGPLVALLWWSPAPTVNISGTSLNHIICGDVLLQSMLCLSIVTVKSPYSWHSHLPTSENKIGHVWAVSRSLTGMSWGWKSEPSQTYIGSESSHLTLKIGSESWNIFL